MLRNVKFEHFTFCCLTIFIHFHPRFLFLCDLCTLFYHLLDLLPLLWGGITQGVPSTATISDLLCVSILVLIIPDSSIRTLWQ